MFIYNHASWLDMRQHGFEQTTTPLEIHLIAQRERERERRREVMTKYDVQK